MGSTRSEFDPTLPAVNLKFSLQDIISEINPADADFLKYFPESVLSQEKIAAVEEGGGERTYKVRKNQSGSRAGEQKRQKEKRLTSWGAHDLNLIPRFPLLTSKTLQHAVFQKTTINMVYSILISPFLR